MNFEQPQIEQKVEKEPNIFIEAKYRPFAPSAFLEDPVGYFEREGENIKSGGVRFKKDGSISEDPTATKWLPTWHNENGNELRVVAKRVNVEKSEIGRASDPFYEFHVMEEVRKRGLPTVAPIAKIEQGDTHLVVMEQASGMRWSKDTSELLKVLGYTDVDIESIKEQTLRKMEQLKEQFEASGIIRKWKLADVLFEIDIEAKKVTGATPIDWERTVIKN
jgi:hypothetical protein